jgi:hypothetical protein
VLLLPAPTVFAATLLGALIRPPKRAVRTIELREPQRARLAGVLALAGTLLILRTVSQLGAMAIFSASEKPERLEWAARLDPGSYRIQMLLGYAWRNRGRCDLARPHAEAARAFFPNHPAPRQLLAACRTRTGK